MRTVLAALVVAVTFPSSALWSADRQVSAPAAAAEQAVRDKLAKRVSFSFHEVPLEAVVEFLHHATDANLVLDQRVQGAGDRRVTLSLTDAPAEDALRFIVRAAGLDWTVYRGVVFISEPTRLRSLPEPRRWPPEPTPEERAVRARLKRPVTLSFVEVPLEAAVGFFSQFSDLSFVVDQRVLVSPPGGKRVTLTLTDLPLGDALDIMLTMLDLRWTLRQPTDSMPGGIFVSDQAGVESEPRVTPAAPTALGLVETELWPVEGDSHFILLSPDGETVVLTVRPKYLQKQYVLKDGRGVRGTYDVLHWVTFSPDGSSLAVAAKSGDKWFMVRDGEALDEGHESVGRPVFSPDSRSLAYAVTDGQERFVLKDGERAGPGGMSWVGDPVFSPDGRSLVYITARGEEYSIVRDGFPVPALGGRVVSRPVFSPDSRSFAYVAESGGLFSGICFLVRDGERVGEEGNFVRGWDDAVSMDVDNPVFSPDGSSLAWVAPAGRRQYLVRDGVRASRDYDSVAGIAFSPDGRSLTFVAHEGGRSIVIRDGVQVGTQYGNVILPIHYSPDGRSIVFKAQQGRRTFIVRDGVQVTPDYEEISNIVTNPDGKGFLLAAIRAGVAYRVEVPWAEAKLANEP